MTCSSRGGWEIQNYLAFNLGASHGIAICKVPLKSGRCDYLLLVARLPVSVVAAKKEGITLSTVADDSGHYAANLPDFTSAHAPSKPRFSTTNVVAVYARICSRFQQRPRLSPKKTAPSSR